jgi:F-type H+-transporting ATPase subunit b
MNNMMFAEAVSESSGGLSALGINLQSFLFQLITFVLVLLILKKFAYGRVMSTLEARRQAIIDSTEDAEAARQKLENSEKEARKILDKTRCEADDIIERARSESEQIVRSAEEKAKSKVELIQKNAERDLVQEVEKARSQLKKETLSLVALSVEKLLSGSMTQKIDDQLIENALKEAERATNAA